MVTLKKKEKRGRRRLNDGPSAVIREILKELSERARPTQRLDIVPWLEKHRRLSPESSAEPGRWSFDGFPYGREISRAIADPNVREVVFRRLVKLVNPSFARSTRFYTGPVSIRDPVWL
jgi:DNA-binding transcriptional ArsR family regulator